MYTYKSSLENRPPVTPQMRALDGLVSPYEYPSTHGDAFNSRAAKVSADYNVAGDQANTDYGLEQQRAQNALVLQGLGALASDQEQHRKVQQSRLDMMRGMRDSFLGGLF